MDVNDPTIVPLFGHLSDPAFIRRGQLPPLPQGVQPPPPRPGPPPPAARMAEPIVDSDEEDNESLIQRAQRRRQKVEAHLERHPTQLRQFIIEDVYGAQEQFGAAVIAQEVEEVARQVLSPREAESQEAEAFLHGVINELQLQPLSPLHPSLLDLARQDQAGPSRPTPSHQSKMMSRIDQQQMVPDYVEVRLGAGEEAEVTHRAAIALCGFRRFAEVRQAAVVHDEDPAAMEVRWRWLQRLSMLKSLRFRLMWRVPRQHNAPPAAEYEIAGAEHIAKPAAGFEVAGNLVEENVEIDFGLNVEDMDVEESGAAAISLNTDSVECSCKRISQSYLTCYGTTQLFGHRQKGRLGRLPRSR